MKRILNNEAHPGNHHHHGDTMTTERDLIQRLVDIADALDGRKHLVFSQGQAMDGFTALANFQALANEARAYLSQPEPEGLTKPPVVTLSALLCPAYEPGDGSADGAQLVGAQWWHPEMGCDSLQVVVDNARAVLARWGRPAVEPPSKPAHNTAQHSSQRP